MSIIQTVQEKMYFLRIQQKLIWSLQAKMMYLFICIYSGGVRSDHKWSLEKHVHVRWEQVRLELSTCD